MKKLVRLTESDLHRIIKGSVKRILKEAVRDRGEREMMFDPIGYRNKNYPKGKEGDNAFSWDKHDMLSNKSNPENIDNAFKRLSGREGEIDWLRNGRKAKEDWLSGKMIPKNKPFPIISDNEGEIEGFEMPMYCYAHGELESDMGYDLFLMPTKILNKISDGTADKYGCQIKIGSYACTYNGKPCTIYSGLHDEVMRRALCCYNDDEEAKEQIADYLNIIPN